MLWEHNKDLFSKKLYMFFSTRDLHMWRLGGPSYRLECTKIWHFQRWSIAGRRFPHLLEFLILPFKLWIFPIFHGLPKKSEKKLTTIWTIMHKKILKCE
jgi:hypothetical protein